MLIIVAIAVATISYVAGTRREAARPAVALPVLPRVDDISLTERLRGKIWLTPGREYTADLEPVIGRLKAALAFGRPDRQRHDDYLRERGSGTDRDVPFTAGALVLRGRAGITFPDGTSQPVIPLDGRTSEHPFFDPDQQRPESMFRLDREYRLTEEYDQRRYPPPVWIVPAIAPHSDKRALELQIQWGHGNDAGPDLELESIEVLAVRYPQSWGEFRRATGGVIVGTGQEPTIEWRHVSPAAHERERKRIDLVAQFEHQIDPDSMDPDGVAPDGVAPDGVAPDSMVRGRLEALFTGAISGIEGLQFFGPLGDSRASAAVNTVRTHVILDFELSLNHTRHQSVRLVPDRGDRDRPEHERPDEYEGVIPNDATVIALTNALADDGYYIKRVIENPPRIATRSNLVRRYWDIAGRRYDGVYPIDFHIILTGEEVHHGGIHAHTGVTKTRLTVHGADDHIAEPAAQAWEALRGKIAEVLRQQQRPRQVQAGLRDRTADESVNGQANSNGRSSARPWKPRNSTRLLELLGRLDEALRHGRISDEHYREMRDKVEQELSGS